MRYTFNDRFIIHIYHIYHIYKIRKNGERMPTSETPPQARVRLTESRVSYNLSQQELADKIGTTYVNVSRWERGITRPNPYFRRKLCSFYQKSEEELDLTVVKSARSAPAGKAATASAAPSASQIIVPQAIYDPAIPLQPAKPLVGREQDLKRIKEQLQVSRSDSLTALNGLPGVGKTALSVAIAHDDQVRTYFKDGILWASVGPQPNIPGVFSRWGNLLGISFTQMTNLGSNEAKAKAIRNAIGGRSLLIIIDDAWKLEEALAFRVGGANCAHIVTTRFPLIASHMASGNAILIRELDEKDSINLLNQLAPQVIYREQQKVHDLVKAVGGLPLALTLMGNYLRKQAYNGPARRITTALERLSKVEGRLKLKEPHIPAESHPSIPIEQSLSIQSIIAVTDQQLDKETQNALYALSVFPPKPNTFSEEAAIAVAACAYDQLDALSDSGLLENNGERYQLHQVISDYALLQIEEDKLDEAQERLITYITNYVQEHKKDYEQLEIENDTIIAALESAESQEKLEELVQITCGFAPFLILRGFYQQASQHLEKAHEVALQQHDTYGVTGTLLYLGQISQKQGNFAQAEKCFQAGLHLARTDKEIGRICELLTGLGSIKWRMGIYDQALQYLHEGLTLARYTKDNQQIVGLLRILGSVVGSSGDSSQAATYFQEALKLAQELGDREQICVLLSNLGKAANEMGNTIQSEQYYKQGLQLARQIGDREQTCVLLINLGDLIGELGDYKQAAQYFQEGLVLARQINHREWISALLINLGSAIVKEKKYQEAEIYFQEGLTIAKQIGIPRITAICLYEYGNLYLDCNQIDQAQRIFNEMLQIILPEHQDLSALANYSMARIAAYQGNITQAKALGAESVKNLESIQHIKVGEAREWLATLK
jgi:tetratricopeptide (TPR) repeat protein/transcriptional regulator with XRE-family HTH domain